MSLKIARKEKEETRYSGKVAVEAKRWKRKRDGKRDVAKRTSAGAGAPPFFPEVSLIWELIKTSPNN